LANRPNQPPTLIGLESRMTAYRPSSLRMRFMASLTESATHFLTITVGQLPRFELGPPAPAHDTRAPDHPAATSPNTAARTDAMPAKSAPAAANRLGPNGRSVRTTVAGTVAMSPDPGPAGCRSLSGARCRPISFPTPERR